MRQFLRVASWYRRFIVDFSTLAAPLSRLTQKNVKVSWTNAEETAFQQLKEALTTAPVLACPDFSRPFTLQTDASTHGLGAVLTQHLNEKERAHSTPQRRVIAYASRTLNSAERNYIATELECLVVVWGFRRMRDYLEGYHFTVLTDHQTLRWLQRIEEPTGRLGRWVFELQQYDFDIQYRRGALNRVADARSRTPETSAVTRAPTCRWYRRILADVESRPADFPDYEVRDGQLHRHILHDLEFGETLAADQWKQCVPTEQRPSLLNRLHDDPTAEHLGVAKTIARVAPLYYWPGMFRDITRYVRQCPNCMAHKASQRRPAGTLRATACTAPWQQAAVDLVGPLPRSTNGHTWLVTMQDRFSKWVEMVPLRRATAENLARAVIHYLIHRCPTTLVSDNGTQFASQRFKELLTAFEITHRKSPVYALQCNPVERAKRTIKTMIAQYVDRRHKNWDERIGALQFAINTAKHEATGYTPAYILHGRELARPHPEDRRPPAPAP